MTPDRRTLLTWGLAGTGLMAMAGVGLGLRPTVPRAAPGPLRKLDPRSYSVLAAIADRVTPGTTDAPTARELDVAYQIDTLLDSLHPSVAWELNQLLKLFDNAITGLLLDGRITTFTASPPEVQDEVLQSWRTSRLSVRRQGYRALRNLCAATYFADPATYASVGYPGPPDFSAALAARRAAR